MVILNHMQGFKNFLLRGNVIDLAVGIIMGTAFTAVVTALVQSVLMPAISMLVQSPNFDSFLVFGQIKVGVFLTAVVNFLLIAAAVYFAVVLPVEKLNAMAKKNKVEEKEDTELSLLKEIRDSLATKK
ncbi:large conductance mechanosensitive channel protein MscL [Rothia aeria]|mgnify:CR=1 FL=1|uniref:large conductance mechanosensitive channel protein MscL n=2 Tax=Rothia aeria TaxID=172042 RepID=UPI0028D3926B|nr:large conductance mechanosensitive channel protein MscL [Rothia aeria]